MENGKIFHGRTFILLNDPESHVFIIFGENDTLYWVEFTDDEYKNNKSLSKMVRLGELGILIFDQKCLKVSNELSAHLKTKSILVERGDDSIKMENDFHRYELTISTGVLIFAPYATQ